MHGWQHTAVNLAALAALLPAALLTGRSEAALPFAAGYLLGTLLVTPDLDLRRNDARRRWGKLAWVWAPYAALSRHRGVSHSYLRGPLVRLLYLLPFSVPVLWLLHPTVAWPPLTLALIGYLVSQWVHLLCDGITPWHSGRL